MAQTLRSESTGQSSEHRFSSRAFVNVIQSRADLGVHAFVDEQVVIGRDPDCEIRLHDFRASRRHALISPRVDGSYTITDLNSTNGTRVNDRPVSGSRQLQNGEKIYIGDTVLHFLLADEMDVSFHTEITTLVSTDPLTGLPSKRKFDRALEYAFETAQQNQGQLALLMMDMDGLKLINDTYGHLFGAFAISQAGQLIADVLGDRGQACRFGGDEFSAFLPDCGPAQAAQTAEQIRQAIEMAAFERDGIELHPTMSIGVACFPAVGKSLLDLVCIADRALYRAKHAGRNRVAA